MNDINHGENKMNAIEKISEKLKEIFGPMDAEVLKSTLEWAEGRRAALKKFEEEEVTRKQFSTEALNNGTYGKYDDPEKIKFGSYEYYDKRNSIAGGKTWYSIITEPEDRRKKLIEKNCKATAEARNARISKKLQKAGVTELISEVFHHTHDGFNGIFAVETNVGRKSIVIDTVYAGGYNIQCLHLRVLVHVR